ncbi:MAG TPA: hypothetical protein VES00_21485 [Burkholderiaceae bacterium]|jgi:hypothetical protein|nr:hypothetical protein [Burkholderiaceae bacterium]
MDTQRTSTPRRRWLLAILLVLAAGAAAAWLLHERWAFRLVDLRFVDHREKVAGGGAALNVTGYVLVRVESDADIFREARDENSYPEVKATLCDSGRRVGAWRDPLPLERDASGKRFVYAVLLPARGRDGELAQAGGAVCLRFMSAGLGLPAWGASGSLKVSLPAAMREQMLAYARREGVVDVSLDPICAPLLCQPD